MPLSRSLTDTLRQLAQQPGDPQSLFAVSAAAYKRGIAYAFAPIVEATLRTWPGNLKLACCYANILIMQKNPGRSADVLLSIVERAKSRRGGSETLPWLEIIAIALQIKRADIANDLIDFLIRETPEVDELGTPNSNASNLVLAQALVMTGRIAEGAKILGKIIDGVRRLNLEPGMAVSAGDAELGRVLFRANVFGLVDMLGSNLVMQRRFAEAAQFVDKMMRNLPRLIGWSSSDLQFHCGAISRFSELLGNAIVEFGHLRRRPQALISLPIWGAKYFDFFRGNVSPFWQKAVSRFPGVIAIQVVTRRGDAELARKLLADFGHLGNVETMCTMCDESVPTAMSMYSIMIESHNVGFWLAREYGMNFFPMYSDAVINDEFFARADHFLRNGYDAIIMNGLLWRDDRLEQLKEQMSHYASIGRFEMTAQDMYDSISERNFTDLTSIGERPGDRSIIPFDMSNFMVLLLDRILIFSPQRFAAGLSPNALRKIHVLPRNTYDNGLTDIVLRATGAGRIWMNGDFNDLCWIGLEHGNRRNTSSGSWRRAPAPRNVGDFDVAALRVFHRRQSLTSPGRLLTLRKPLVVRFSHGRSGDREEARYRARFERIADLLGTLYFMRESQTFLRNDVVRELADNLFQPT